MNLYDIYNDYNQSKNKNKLIMLFIEGVKSIINYYKYKLPISLQDDYFQDVMLKILLVFKNQSFVFIFPKNSEELSYLIEHQEDNENRDEIRFLKIYSENETLSFEKFRSFVFDIKFRNYFKIICYRVYCDILRVIKKDKELLKSLELSENIEEIEYNLSSLSKEDRLFLRLFIENDRLLSQKEVGNKLNITQQSVSKRISKIKEKVKNKKML